ncbi:MAG TPA: thiamine pyrophosphate-binding protein [Candidatus Nanoarchaeia archaeon]|nr:thiamine pyrophosphate-binding protein [Candidatus Nanoarchaeia archaeon]
MRVADYIIDFVSSLGVKHIFSIPGGGSMYMNDALGKSKSVRPVSTHHEQALSMAVESYARVNGFGVGMVTTGPGGTNAVTGVAGAWIDSTPCIYLSGQISLKDTILGTNLRQRGVQEIDIISIVKPITKYAVMVKDPGEIKYELQKAVHIAKSGRSGPVWLDIPLNVQSGSIEPDKLKEFRPSKEEAPIFDSKEKLKENVSKCISLLKKSKRPVLWVGNGIKLAKAEKEMDSLISRLKIPVLTTWNGADLVDNENEFYIGRPGLFGQRGANFSVQNSDLIIAVGNRLSIPQTGFNFSAFGRGSKKVFVDIDKSELNDKPFKADTAINSDAKEFLSEMNLQLSSLKDKNENNYKEWVQTCKKWVLKYPVVLPAYLKEKKVVSSYVFIDKLSDSLSKDDVIVTDMGTSFTTTFQTFKVKKGQKFFTSSGLASMGFGLPGAIGACFANDKKRTICIAGEGSFMFNIQELQTVVHHSLPIKIFLFNNNSYLSIKAMQDANFGGFHVGSDRESGLTFPDMVSVAKSFKIKTERINNHSELHKILEVIESDGPVFCEVVLGNNEILSPRLKTIMKKDGSMSQSPLEDMWPFLDRKELKENMMIPILDEEL